MRKADLISEISDKTGIPKVDVMVTLETMFKEIKKNIDWWRKHLYTWVWQFYYKKTSC
jgi:nucleoid DNA-binding protein